MSLDEFSKTVTKKISSQYGGGKVMLSLSDSKEIEKVYNKYQKHLSSPRVLEIAIQEVLNSIDL